MAVISQDINDQYALYNGDCCDVLPTLPDNSIHMSIYSPPFAGLYHYSSSPRDMSNNPDYETFFQHYDFVVRELTRVTMPGRMTAVHCSECKVGGEANLGGELMDLPGDIIRQHVRLGWGYVARYSIWKEPLQVRNRTMSKGLAHCQIVDDSSRCDNARADCLLVFRNRGTNPVPITHPTGLLSYAGERQIPSDLYRYRGWTGNQIQNKFSHWIWRQYASAFWDDIRLGRVLPYLSAIDPEDEKHANPLQLDVIDRACVLWSNPGENVLSPFMGVGSEVYGAVTNGRKGIGIELKTVYYKQAVLNVGEGANGSNEEQLDLLNIANI